MLYSRPSQIQNRLIAEGETLDIISSIFILGFGLVCFICLLAVLSIPVLVPVGFLVNCGLLRYAYRPGEDENRPNWSYEATGTATFIAAIQLCLQMVQKKLIKNYNK